MIPVVGLQAGILCNLDDGKQDLDSYALVEVQTVERNAEVEAAFIKKDGTEGRRRQVPLNSLCFGSESAQRILSLSDDAFRM